MTPAIDELHNSGRQATTQRRWDQNPKASETKSLVWLMMAQGSISQWFPCT
jgi:hypothetical protein